MNQRAFQLNKVRRTIRTLGQSLLVQREGTNDFGEPNGETESLELKGVFHESTGYLTKSTSESSTVRKKSSPMLLCLWEDVENRVHLQDHILLNGRKYMVGEIKNLLEANLMADISLEEIQT